MIKITGLLILFINLSGKFYQNNNQLIFNCIQSYNQESEQDFIYECMFKFPKLLKMALENKQEVILVTQDNLNDTGTLDKESNKFEPQRVAATWLTIYKNFFNLNGKITTAHTINKGIDVEVDIQTEDTLVLKHHLNNSPRKQRFLITGGAGFLGSHLTNKLLELGHQVIVLENYECCRKDNLNSHPNLAIVDHDVTKPFSLQGDLDYVIHLASLPSPEFYYKKPIETLTCGLHGTLNTLKLALEKNAKYLLASTSEVYGDPFINPQPETYAGNVNYLGPRAQYDESKRGAEILAKLFLDTKDLDVRIVRIFNTYGPNMMLNDGRVVTNFIRASLNKESLTIYGDGNQTRSFAYVDDTVNGIEKLIFHEFKSNIAQDRVFNIGNETEISINQFAETVAQLSEEILQYKPQIKYFKHFDYTDPLQRRPDLTKSKSVLSYYPSTTLKEGLKKTLEYFISKQTT